MDIRNEQITFVVQGALVDSGQAKGDRGETIRTLRSIRDHFPGSTIILSTWKGANTEGLDFDRLVLSDDPGALPSLQGLQRMNNVNRQIVTTLSGLRQVATPYAVKLRSDNFLEGRGFLEYFRKYSATGGKYRFVRDRVIGCTAFANNPRSLFPTPFHPSDWFFFGNTEDLLAIWDIPLAPEPETSTWFLTHPRKKIPGLARFNMRYAVEQYIWLSCLRKAFPEIELEDCADCSGDKIEVSERTLAENLVILPLEKLSLRFPKYEPDLAGMTLKTSLYTHWDWQQMYRRHCDPSFAITEPNPSRDPVHFARTRLLRARLRLRGFIFRNCFPLYQFLFLIARRKWIDEAECERPVFVSRNNDRKNAELKAR